MNPKLLRNVAKTGYTSRGVVYLIVGGLALSGAFGGNGDATDTKGALLKLFDTGYGTTLLVVIALGLLCYAGWRFFQSLADADRHGTDMKGIAVRGGLMVSAVSHTALGLWALYAALAGTAGGDSGKSGLAAWLMQQPFGPWLVALAGACIVGAGGAHIVKGATRGFEKWLQADERKMKVVRPVSMTGLIARGIVFLIIGGLFIYAGFTVDPQKAGGMREALQWLRAQPFGTPLFVLIAFGLVCFGAYSFAEAAYRRLDAGEKASRAAV